MDPENSRKIEGDWKRKKKKMGQTREKLDGKDRRSKGKTKNKISFQINMSSTHVNTLGEAA